MPTPAFADDLRLHSELSINQQGFGYPPAATTLVYDQQGAVCEIIARDAHQYNTAVADALELYSPWGL